MVAIMWLLNRVAVSTLFLLPSALAYSPPRLYANFTECKAEILRHNATSGSSPLPSPVFVDFFGRPTANASEVKGVDYQTCISYCGKGRERPRWSFFAPQFSAWLLPFIALTAQFPYQAGGTWDNFMSAFLTVGSPALAMYSLILTFLNSRWLHKRCWEVLDQIPANTGERRRRRQKVKNIFKSLKQVVCFAQQEPYERVEELRVTADIDSALEDDDQWWKKVAAAVQKTKRGYSASFVHQLLWVNIAFAFTMVDAFGSEKIGNVATAFGLAISLVWQWETPIVIGWVLVGTQAVDYGVRSALAELSDIGAGLIPPATAFFEPYNQNVRRGGIPGDRQRPGPIFNYARVFSWMYRAEYMLEYYRRIVDTGIPDVSMYMELDPEYRHYAVRHIIYAAGLALIMQWSTAGASVFLNWLTPTIGLACRSGGILIYAVVATTVLFLLIASSWLSDFWVNEVYCNGIKRQAGWYSSVSLLGSLAVFLRALGKLLTILNAIWICLHCMFEFTNFYENCWCKTTYLSLGNRAFWTWVPDSELRSFANVTEVWGGASALAIVIPLVFIAIFLVHHHHYAL